MKLNNITILTGNVHEFYSRALWSELIKAGAAFTAEVQADAAHKAANKIVVAYTLQTKPVPQDVERLMYWVRQWANTHYATPMSVHIYTPLPSAVKTKLQKMISGSELIEACKSTHSTLIPEAQ